MAKRILEDMSVYEILEEYDFPDAFIEDFKNWCDLKAHQEKTVKEVSDIEEEKK